MERIGVKMVITKEGRLKDMFQPFREPTAEEQEKVQALTSEIYEWFVDAVATSRRLDPEVVREYATGEMFSATKGREMGLIDELGDWETVLDMASEMGRAPRWRGRSRRSWSRSWPRGWSCGRHSGMPVWVNSKEAACQTEATSGTAR